jgi:hypothetical protein
MIEVKKYIEEDELHLEFLKILSEAARKVALRASEINKASLNKISLSSTSEIDSETVEYLIHAFRAELYKADLSVSQLQDLLAPKGEAVEKDNTEDVLSEQ